MAAPSGSGALRDRIRFEQRGDDGPNGPGSGEWAPVIDTLAAQLQPLRGGEAVQAQRQTGLVPFEAWLHWSPSLLAITSDCRVVDSRDDRRTFAIKAGPLDLDGKRKWLLFQLEQGPADG